MTLNEQLMRLKDYNVGFNVYEGSVIVNVTYKKGWDIIPVDNSDVEMFCEDGKYYYCMPIDEDINLIFGIIEDTIKYNQDMEKKIQLFNQKVDELKQLFINESYDSLLSLSFDMRKGKKRRKTEKRAADAGAATPCAKNTRTAAKDDAANVTANEAGEIDMKVNSAVALMENNDKTSI